MQKLKITVAVSGLNNTDNPGPGIPVIRALRESKIFDVRIIGLSYESLEPGIYLRDLVDKVYQVPYPSVGSDMLLGRIQHINSIEKINVLIPNFDAELYSFISFEQKLAEMGIATFLPTMAQFEERHKTNLPAYGKKYGVLIPHSKPITSITDLNYLSPEFSYPLLVKGKFYDAYVANNQEQAAQYFNKLSSKWGLPIIIQQFVKGTEVNVIALGDGKGNTISAVPMRKQYITDKGKAWGGITLDDQDMLELTKKLIKKTNWRGGMELELIKTDKNEYYLIEINPRIPAWVYLAVGAGQNIPEALVQMAMGKTVEPFTTYEVGKMFIRYSMDLIVNLSDFEKLSTSGEL